jgi:hypothetical protein
VACGHCHVTTCSKYHFGCNTDAAEYHPHGTGRLPTNLDARLCGLAKLFVVSYVEAFAPCALAPAAAGVAVVSAVRAAVAVVMAVVAAGFTVVVVVLSAIGAITVVAARRLNYVTSV